MTQLSTTFRIRLSAAAFFLSGILFVVYPATRPFSDESSLDGAAAFATMAWLTSHILGIIAFTLIPLGLLGLYLSANRSDGPNWSFGALVLAILGAGLLLPFYGGEAYGLHAVGLEAQSRQDVDLLIMAQVIRSGPGLLLFAAGLILMALAAILAAISLWKTSPSSRWSGLPFALGMVLYIPQFFLSQPWRIAHGILVGVGCVWMGIELWKQIRRA